MSDVFEKWCPALVDIVNQLPCLQTILGAPDTIQRMIYGGFLRFFFSWIFDFGVPPQLTDVLKYLESGDVDIQITTDNPKSTFGHILSCVQKFGGTIEYFGVDYDDVECPSFAIRRNYAGLDGLFGIYLPMGSKFVRYDLMFHSSIANKYSDDFTVNALQLIFHPLFPPVIRTPSVFSLSEIADDLRTKRIRGCTTQWSGYNLAKRLYRVLNLDRQNFKIDPSDVEQFKQAIESVTESILISRANNFPSKDFSVDGHVFASEHPYINITHSDWLKRMSQFVR